MNVDRWFNKRCEVGRDVYCRGKRKQKETVPLEPPIRDSGRTGLGAGEQSWVIFESGNEPRNPSSSTQSERKSPKVGAVVADAVSSHRTYLAMENAGKHL